MRRSSGAISNWQHSTMYFFYGVSGVVDIILTPQSCTCSYGQTHARHRRLVGSRFVLLPCARRQALDVHIHLLLYSQYLGELCASSWRFFPG
ncbi:hypothetical protein GDO81_006856 [Engystomops pustulosus]|uniref:Uncharacterized protein n=1 Tax=Engystomops pustulosus TaxID=76066 RepID=A0AAV7D216_ENGPU|nr:hypothetical protein GDO81_006856 [Engystomops pustulosus]